MANTGQTNQTSYKQQTLAYSPPQQPTEELNESSIPVQVPTLTPPHSSNTTAVHHHKQQTAQQSQALIDSTSFINANKQSSTSPPPQSKQSSTTTAATATTATTAASASATSVNKPTNQCLPPRKRIQSLKKQFTKPNLSAPVISHTNMETQESHSTTTARTLYSPSSAIPAIPSTSFSHTASRSPSPFVDIEDNSGETTETDDDDWQQRKASSTALIKADDDDKDYLFNPTKHAIIINQQQQQQQQDTLPTPSPDHTFSSSNNKASKAKKPLKKHWDTASLQAPSRGLDRQDSTKDEKKPKKQKKKAGRSSEDTDPPVQPSKIRKTGSGRPSSKSRMKKSGALYCICQTPYDAPRFMIACDRCDQWFHGECIGISEKQGEFIDSYYCDVCGKETGKSTSWKSKCGNPACSKSARISSHQGHLSKYCSHDCGMQVARARLELTEMKKRATTTETTSSIPQITIDKQRHSRLSSHAEKEDQHRLEQLRKQKLRALEMVRMIEHKQRFLELATGDLGDTCGFDSRLVWDDALWIKVQGIIATGTALVLQYDDKDNDIEQEPYWQCQHPRKDCRQHQQWPRLLDLEMKQERKEQLQVIKRLEKEKLEIKHRMRQRRNQMDLADSLANGTITY